MSLQPLEAEILVELHQVLNLVTGPDSTFRLELQPAGFASSPKIGI